MGPVDDPTVRLPRLNGARILIVEDDFFIGLELAAILSDAGAEVVGPSVTVESALTAAQDVTLGAAILDIRLGNDTVAPVARWLTDDHLPFAFYTRQTNTDPIRAEWPNSSILSKPALPQSIIRAVAALLSPRTPSTVARR